MLHATTAEKKHILIAQHVAVDEGGPVAFNPQGNTLASGETCIVFKADVLCLEIIPLHTKRRTGPGIQCITIGLSGTRMVVKRNDCIDLVFSNQMDLAFSCIHHHNFSVYPFFHKYFHRVIVAFLDGIQRHLNRPEIA